MIDGAASSRKLKEQIKDLGPDSNVIYRLKPVTYILKSDATRRVNKGLIAEDVAAVLPEIVVFKDGEPSSVRYDELMILMLNEVQTLYKVMAMHESSIYGLAAKVAALDEKIRSMSRMNMCP